MSAANSTVQKMLLIAMVRTVAKMWNEDEKYWSDYIKEVLNCDRQAAFECFRDLLEQGKWIGPRRDDREVKKLLEEIERAEAQEKTRATKTKH